MSSWPTIARYAGSLAAAVVLLLGTGCMTSTPQLHHVAHGLEQALPGTTLRPEGGVKLGRASLGFARWVSQRALEEDDEETRAAVSTLRGIRRVEVGTYRVQGLPLRFEHPREMEQALGLAGWTTLARVQQDDDLSWVVYRQRDRRIRSLLVINVEGEELSMVRLQGRLEDTLAAALDVARGEAELR
ncbi:MAG: DUF4252 domain-containing protein [Acidobacteriota bacterium]|nr:DUF4252 domain-containing protein [Acidobacteriota bacterium]